MQPRTSILARLLVVGVLLAAGPTPGTAQPASVTFTAAGDYGSTPTTIASLVALAEASPSFHLALGDLKYEPGGTELVWCDLVTSHVGAAFPFQLLAGNHDDDTPTNNGFIDNLAACLPDRMSSTGRYGAEYYFDYGGLLRVILIAPNLQVGGESYDYVPGNLHYDWLAQRIDEARVAGIPWVVVGMHKVCITVGAKGCEIGTPLLELLIAKRVDLVLQGHDHTYQRSKQLMCAFVDRFDSSCVADDGADGRYARGAGTVFVIAGTFGKALYDIQPSDPEAGYFARSMGGNLVPTNGFLTVTVSATELTARFVATSGRGFTDHFTIGPSSDFDFLAVHPWAAAQQAKGSVVGQRLGTLFGWRGQLYVGYGDVNLNTGPIAVTSWDPVAAAFREHWVSETEAIFNYRAFGSRLYAPANDAHNLPVDFAVGEPWEDRHPVGTLHAFDMISLTGGDLWLAGQTVGTYCDTVGNFNSDAVAWRSLDGGVTWAEAMRIPPRVDCGVARFYFAGAYQGKLYLQPVDFGQTGLPSRVFDGTTWTDGPTLLPMAGATGWRPVVFAGRMVYRSRWPQQSAPSQLLAFDGEEVTFPLVPEIYDFTVSGPALFALTTGGAVLRTTDLVSWTPVAIAPAEARSIGTLNGRLYVGTADSRLYRLRQPLARVGPVDVVVRGTDDGLYHNRLLDAAWSGWTPVGGATRDDPALASPGDGTLDLAVRGLDQGIYVSRFAGGWPGWTGLPGATPATPALVSRPGLRRDLFVVGTDGGIYRNGFNGTVWGGWENLRSVPPAPDTVAVTANGLLGLDLVARLADGSLRHLRSVDGATWTAPPLGGAASAVPAVGSTGDGTLHVVVAGTDGALYHNRFDTAWSDWTSLGGATPDAPALVVHLGGVLDVVVRGTDSGIYHNRFDGSRWLGWVALPGATSSAPALAGGDGALDLVVCGIDGGIYHNRFDGAAWLGWTSPGGGALGRPAITSW